MDLGEALSNSMHGVVSDDQDVLAISVASMRLCQATSISLIVVVERQRQPFLDRQLAPPNQPRHAQSPFVSALIRLGRQLIRLFGSRTASLCFTIARASSSPNLRDEGIPDCAVLVHRKEVRGQSV